MMRVAAQALTLARLRKTIVGSAEMIMAVASAQLEEVDHKIVTAMVVTRKTVIEVAVKGAGTGAAALQVKLKRMSASAKKRSSAALKTPKDKPKKPSVTTARFS